MWQHDMEQFARRWRAFGWHAIVIDGHDMAAILDALAEARRTKGQPTMILARTIKGKGVSFVEGKERLARQGVQEGRGARSRARRAREAVRARRRRASTSRSRFPEPAATPTAAPVRPKPMAPPALRSATRSRRARPTARRIAKLGEADRASSRSTPT